MTKKRDRTKKPSMPRGWKAPHAQVMRWLDDLEDALRDQNFKLAKQLAQKTLRHVPVRSQPGKDALGYLGMALGMLDEYEASYQALSEALVMQPERADLWYNRSLSACFTVRTGQSLRDLEQAVALEHNPSLLATYNERLDFMRQIVAEELALRGPDFTLEQLIEQQQLFNQALALYQSGLYTKAGLAFKRVIDIADVLPQPWANLAGCYMWQERYDEAEAALHRALEIDPDYQLAQENLLYLPTVRQYGLAALKTSIKPAFAEGQISRSVIFTE